MGSADLLISPERFEERIQENEGPSQALQSCQQVAELVRKCLDAFLVPNDASVWPTGANPYCWGAGELRDALIQPIVMIAIRLRSVRPRECSARTLGNLGSGPEFDDIKITERKGLSKQKRQAHALNTS